MYFLGHSVYRKQCIDVSINVNWTGLLRHHSRPLSRDAAEDAEIASNFLYEYALICNQWLVETNYECLLLYGVDKKGLPVIRNPSQVKTLQIVPKHINVKVLINCANTEHFRKILNERKQESQTEFQLMCAGANFYVLNALTGISPQSYACARKLLGHTQQKRTRKPKKEDCQRMDAVIQKLYDDVSMRSLLPKCLTVDACKRIIELDSEVNLSHYAKRIEEKIRK